MNNTVYTHTTISFSLYIYIYWGRSTLVEGDLEAHFSITTTSIARRGSYSFPYIAPLILDPYTSMLCVRKEGIKYHFLCRWHDLIRDWTPLSQTVGKHSEHYSNGIYIYIYIYIWNGHGDPTSNPGWGGLHFTYLGKGMNQTVLPLVIRKIVAQTGHFWLSMTPLLGERKPCIQSSETLLKKLTLCIYLAYHRFEV